jgi:hypothetical protein
MAAAASAIGHTPASKAAAAMPAKKRQSRRKSAPRACLCDGALTAPSVVGQVTTCYFRPPAPRAQGPRTPPVQSETEPPRGVAQLAEHRSPKPGVAGSSPVAPVNHAESGPRGPLSRCSRSELGQSSSRASMAMRRRLLPRPWWVIARPATPAPTISTRKSVIASVECDPQPPTAKRVKPACKSSTVTSPRPSNRAFS